MSSPLHAIMHALAQINGREIAVGVALFLLSFFGSLAAVAFILCRLPADYLRHQNDAVVLEGRPGWQRVLLIVGKNLLGVLLVAIGVVLSLPGVPGQGILTILIGVMLLDFPGKRAMEHRLISRPSVFSSINKLRERFGRPPLQPAEIQR